jgi:hypothetical protein
VPLSELIAGRKDIKAKIVSLLKLLNNMKGVQELMEI